MAIDQKEAKECFDVYDKDGKGKILTSDLGDALRSLGQVWTQAEVEQLKQGKGAAVSWNEFLDVAKTRPQKKSEQSAVLMKAFQVFDTSENGQIDIGELRHIVTTLGEKMTAQEFENIMRVAGLPATGKLDYKTLVDKAVNA
mmetsp:Transcript_152299/g.283757  ORF Transcript_152299/g.283757 Transcript_152299/m.283757 type:complete len:142 (-) Transcript_152299:60-485(-)